MSDIENETNAFIALVKDADQKMETAHADMMAGIGPLEALFAAETVTAVIPDAIDDIIGQFDQDLQEITQQFHDVLVAEIIHAKEDFVTFDAAARALTTDWTSEQAEAEGQLKVLLAKIGEIEGHLHDTIADLFVPALSEAETAVGETAQALQGFGNEWSQALSGDLLETFQQAWHDLGGLITGQHSDAARSLIDTARDQTGNAIEHLIEQATVAVGDIGHGVEDAISALASHVGDDVQHKLAEAIHHVIETAVKEMMQIVVQSIEVAAIGEAITTALASTGVLEILIPLNALADAILQAIELFKRAFGLLG